MNHLTLNVIEVGDEFDKPPQRLQILIDGNSFLDLVREVELPWATREGYPGLAGSYIWFQPYRWVVDRDLSAAELPEGGSKHICFLVCGCEHLGCKTFSGQISRHGGTVVWSNFRNDNRGPNWRLDALGPFVFDLEQYQAEIGGIEIIPDG